VIAQRHGIARSIWILAAVLGTVAAGMGQDRQAARIDVQHYNIEADVNPQTQVLTAKVKMQFVPQDDTSTAVFDLNNALNVSKVETENGQEVSATRSRQDSSVTLNFPDLLTKGKPVTVTFSYDGRLTGNEDSPVFGIKFAAIHADYAYLLYPSRWFPIPTSTYSVNRFTSDVRVTVPAGLR